MNTSRHNVAMVLVSGLALYSFLVLMTAIKGDNTLRTVLAAGGFLAFGGLLTALLISRFKAKA